MGTNALNDRRAGLDVPLTNLSIGIPIDQKWIGDKILPVLRVPTSVVKLPVFGDEAFRIRDDKVGDYSQPEKIDISLGTTLLEVDGHSLEAPVSDRHQIEGERAPLQIDLDFEALQVVKANMALSREKLQADLLTNPAIYTSAGHAIDLNGIEWNDPAIDPLDAIVDPMEGVIPDDSGEVPNTFWMGQPVWKALRMNPKLRARAYGTVGPVPMLNTAKLAELIGVATVLVGRAISKTQGGVVTKLWGNNAGLVFVPPTTGKRIPAFGYTVEETVFGSATEKVVRIRDEHMGASGGNWVKRSHFYTPTATLTKAGVLFQNAVAA